MDLGLLNKIVLVAGGSRGIGYATAHAFIAEGAKVVITGRDANVLRRSVKTLEIEFGKGCIIGIAGDLSKSVYIVRTLEKIYKLWGGIDCLVANIGSGKIKKSWLLSDADWNGVFDVNLSASRRLVDAVLPTMMRARQGSVICIASIAGLECIHAPLPYSAAKAALISYGKNLARQVGRFNIRVNVVAPGNVLFEGGSWERKLARNSKKYNHYIKTEVALQRFASVEEIADVIVFLSSRRAAFITGTCVVADGGQTRGISL